MLMMRPGRFCSTIPRLAARVRRNVPRRFTASTRSHTIGSSSHTRSIAPVPAELRRMSRRPKRAIVSATARSQSPASLTSPATVATASRPSAAAVSSRRSGLWSKTATRAPAATQAAAAARPIPDAPPLTSATLPAKLQVMSDMTCVYSSGARACQPGALPLQYPAMVIRPGVSAIILTGEGLLLQRRSDNGLWGLPGGGVEPGESVTEAVVRAHTRERAEVRYRRADGTYDQAAIARIRRAFRSSGDDGEGRASLRLIEVLSWVQKTSRVRPLTLMSGYRSPGYNEGLRAKGMRAAGGSLHTEGLAADVAFPRAVLRPLWMKVRALDCCGAGYYAKEGFLHIDVGQPRFWEPSTSRVEENLSAGNARLFARTEFDRYAKGEEIVVALHAMTVPPVRVGREGEFGVAQQGAASGTLDAGGTPGDGCVELDASRATVRLRGMPGAGRGTLRLAICEPRPERTPTVVETSVIEVR